MPQSPRAKKATKKRETIPRNLTPDDFVSVARRLECDEDKGRFEKKLGVIAKQKPKEPEPKKRG